VKIEPFFQEGAILSDLVFRVGETDLYTKFGEDIEHSSKFLK